MTKTKQEKCSAVIHKIDQNIVGLSKIIEDMYGDADILDRSGALCIKDAILNLREARGFMEARKTG